MNKNRIYTFDINEGLDGKLKDFQTQLNEGEEIVSSVVAGTKLVVTTKESAKGHKKIKNLLLEDLAQKNVSKPNG